MTLQPAQPPHGCQLLYGKTCVCVGCPKSIVQRDHRARRQRYRAVRWPVVGVRGVGLSYPCAASGGRGGVPICWTSVAARGGGGGLRVFRACGCSRPAGRELRLGARTSGCFGRFCARALVGCGGVCVLRGRVNSRRLRGDGVYARVTLWVQVLSWRGQVPRSGLPRVGFYYGVGWAGVLVLGGFGVPPAGGREEGESGECSVGRSCARTLPLRFPACRPTGGVALGGAWAFGCAPAV